MKHRTRHLGDLRWEGVAVEPYKAGDCAFHGATRQVLFGRGAGVACELRYFELEPGGYTTLERHQHVHAVVILRGAGRALADPEVFDLAPFDLVHVPPRTWHQLRAAPDSPLGFLCLVDCERDRPERPDAAALEALRGSPEIARFIRP